MSSIINNQLADIALLEIPQGTGIYNNTSPSLPPTQGSICWDASGVAGAIYSGTGLSWIAAAQGGNVVGPSVSTNNDLVAFDGLTGKLIKSSAIQSGDVVKASSTSVSGNLASYNGTGGRVIQDSGVAMISETVSPITMTSGAGNPSLTGGFLYLQRILVNGLYMVHWSVAFLQAITVTTPDEWGVTVTIPAGYGPPFNEIFPAIIFNNTDNEYVTGAFIMHQNGSLSINIRTPLVAKNLTFSNFSGIYKIT